MRKILMLLLLLCCACDPMSDRKVERYNIQLASDLKIRGQFERQRVIETFESFRSQKMQEIDNAHNQALLFLEQTNKLDAKSSKKASDTFQVRKDYFNNRITEAKKIALEQCDWYDTAANTILATVEYMQTKDAAIVEGAKAALEAFTQTYVATRHEPTDAAEKSAEGLIDKLNNQLTTLLAGQLGVPK